MTDHPKDHDTQLAALYTPKPASNTGSATAADHTNSYSKASVRDGEVIAIHTGKVSQTSNEAITQDANAAANVPWSRAISPQGNHVPPHEVKDDTRITLPGIGEVTMGQAKAAGFLPSGWMSHGSQPTSSQPQPTSGEPNRPFEPPKAEVHPDLDATAFADPAIEQAISTLVDNTGGFEQMQAIQQIVQTGEVDTRTLGTIADQLRIEPGKVQEQLVPIMQAFENQARAVMSEGGVNADDVIAFAQEHRRDKLNLAMNKHATQRNTAGYASLRSDYLASLGEHRPEVALAADLGPGNSAYKDDKGRVLVRMADGSTMLWRSAIQAFAAKK